MSRAQGAAAAGSLGVLADDQASWFIGEQQAQRLPDGSHRRQAYLDSAATTLPLLPVTRAVMELLPQLGNGHSRSHFSARFSARTLEWARSRILQFVGASEAEYAVLFCGHGTTAAINRFATKLARLHPERSSVLLSSMEHHSNDLPHRKWAQVEHVRLASEGAAGGGVLLSDLDDRLRRLGSNARYVAITAASNATGCSSPLAEISSLCHRHGVPLLLDAAAFVPHAPLNIDALGVDAVAFSGHKLYAPMSPGVLIVRRKLLRATDPVEVGGGMVDLVSTSSFTVKQDLVAREQAGTMNVGGALMLALACDWLTELGMDRVHAHGQMLTQYLMSELAGIPGLRTYGPARDDRQRVAAIVPFNVQDIPHGLVAAVLNDAHQVAVRSDCFCAQPYVRRLLRDELLALSDDPALTAANDERYVEQRRGMVRVSFGLNNSRADVDQLIDGLHDLCANRGRYQRQYTHVGSGLFEPTRAGAMDARPDSVLQALHVARRRLHGCRLVTTEHLGGLDHASGI